jgi:tetratricopeptide (TPR) repeat protein
MKELRRKETFCEKIIEFLKLVDYFDSDELNGLQGALEKWELRREWEKLKERADFFARKKEPEKAIPLYRRALQYEENASVLNNLGVQYMQISATFEGLSCMARALALEPANFTILLHYIEAAVLHGDYDKAAKGIQKAYSINPNHADIAYLLGLMSFRQNDFSTALTYFEKAIAADKTVPHYSYAAADIHLQLRQYEKALGAIEKIVLRDTAYYAKEAEIYAAWGDISRAVKSMTQIPSLGGDAALYAKLAAYHRKNYDTAKAETAIQKALSLSPENKNYRGMN